MKHCLSRFLFRVELVKRSARPANQKKEEFFSFAGKTKQEVMNL